MHRTSTLSNTLNSFGSIMEGRSYEGDTSLRYRFGFNGKENDNEIYGVGNGVDFGARIYDSRLGRWLAVDNRSDLYVPITPYAFSLNKPIVFIDRDGNIIYDSDGNKVTITFDTETGAITSIKGTKDLKLVALLNKTYSFSTEGKAAIEKLNAPGVDYYIEVNSKRAAFQVGKDYGEAGGVSGVSEDKKKVYIFIYAVDAEETGIIDEKSVKEMLVVNEEGTTKDASELSQKVQKKIIKDVNNQQAQKELDSHVESLKKLTTEETENYNAAQTEDSKNKETRSPNTLIYEYNNATARINTGGDVNSPEAMEAGETAGKKAVANSYKERNTKK